MVLAAVIALLFVATISFTATTRGPWLDEFWSLRLGDSTVALGELLRSRWLYDVHPLPANALYAITQRLVGAADVEAARLVLNLSALLFLVGASALFWSRSRGPRAFYPLSTLLLLGTYSMVALATEYRAYFWLLAMTSVGIQYVHWALENRDRRWPVHLVGAFAVLLSLNLHFVGTLLIAPAYALMLAAGWWCGHRRIALRLGLLVCLGLLSACILAIVQHSHLSGLYDVKWITTSTGQALLLFAKTAVKILISLAAAAAVLVLAIVQRRDTERSAGQHEARLFAAALCVAILVGAVALLAINAIQPLVIVRYLAPWLVIAACAAALLVSTMAPLRRATAVIALWTLTQILLGIRDQTQPLWREGTAVARPIIAACPQTDLLFAPSWRFTPFADSRMAAFDSAVQEMGADIVGREAGVQPKAVGPAGSVTIALGRCPTLLWIAHNWGVDTNAPAASILRTGNIVVPPGARVTKLFESDGTVLVRIDQPTNAAHSEATRSGATRD